MFNPVDYDKEVEIRGFNNGYLYFIDKTHPLATGNSYRVYLHRHLASIKLNRWLTKEEHVHHIDNNCENNSLDNLLVCSAAEHAIIHNGTVTEKLCKYCSKEFKGNRNAQEFCSVKCAQNHQVKNRVKNKTITKELLDSLIPTTSWVALGQMFGYSDVGIKKRAKALNCVIPVKNKKRA
jgi:hypothetical protein